MIEIIILWLVFVAGVVTGQRYAERAHEAECDKQFYKESQCDCDDPSQCWEPCGRLGHDEKFARRVK